MLHFIFAAALFSAHSAVVQSPLAVAAETSLDGWTALRIPALSEPPLQHSARLDIGAGTHIQFDDYEPQSNEFRPAPYLPLIQVIELLEADARRAGTDLRCLRTAPPLLARGSTAGIERARALLRELDRAGRAQRIDLNVLLSPTGTEDSKPTTIELRSSESVLVGDRESISFLADYDVNVGSGSGAATPRLGRVNVGKSVALSAWRTPDGEAVFVSGTLDLSELKKLDSFEPGNPELGVLELPTVGTVVVHFSGVLNSGDELVLKVSGAPLEQPDWKLSIRAATSPDQPDIWRVTDLAWFEALVESPSMIEPGAGLVLPDGPSNAHTELEPLPAAILWGELEASFVGRRTDRPLFALAPAVIVAPADDLRIWGELDPLLTAAREARETTTPLTVSCSGVEVQLSASEGMQCAVQAGTERTALVGYDVDIAQDYWIADPIVERLFDGFFLQARVFGGELSGSYWIAQSEEQRDLDREDVIHGRVNLPHRRLSVGSVRVSSGAQVRTHAGLSISVGSL